MLRPEVIEAGTGTGVAAWAFLRGVRFRIGMGRMASIGESPSRSCI